jgi:hypothetical protein
LDTFLSDGGETVRYLPRRLNPESERWLDWFHITMRLTMMGQMAKGIASEMRKLLKAVREFGNYITANQSFIPNYGDRY